MCVGPHNSVFHLPLTARVDYCNNYCNMVLTEVCDRQTTTGAERRRTSRQRHAQVYRGLSQILHADLHWLDVADRVRHKLGVTVHRCLHNKAPQCLVDCCVPVSDIASRQRLRSARCCLLTVPRHRRSTLEVTCPLLSMVSCGICQNS